MILAHRSPPDLLPHFNPSCHYAHMAATSCRKLVVARGFIPYHCSDLATNLLSVNSSVLNKVLLLPACRVVQQLASGVHSLSVMSSAVVHHAQQLSTGVTNLTSRLDSLLGWAKKQEQRNQLAAQQALGQHAGQLGLSLLLVALGVTALRVGRVWEVHQVSTAGTVGASLTQLHTALVVVLSSITRIVV